jgi:GTPase Era involved in 16S rRNA processing
VRPVEWMGCRFFDTPGTNGWGRSESRETLEQRARAAVETADVVVLCFDTQSQQNGEFEKISLWVKEYQKPVLVVLNVRNPCWRDPESLPLRTQRQRLSRGVREHVSNIESELGALELFSVPVVALSSQRAVYGRVDRDYRGPQKEQFEKLRERHGAPALFKGSNMEVLESLLVEALSSNAVELRLGMLYGQVRALLERLERTMEAATEETQTAAEVLERMIQGVFAIIGYPIEGSESRAVVKEAGASEDLLSRLEKLRGGTFDAPAEGKLSRFAHQRIQAEIGILRSRSLAAAEEQVIRAFEERREMKAEEFNKAVYSQDSIQTACSKVLAESVEFLKRETEFVSATARLDFDFALSEQAVHGKAGKWRRIGGYAASAGGVLAGLAGSLMTVALLDPEPVSKVLLLVGSLLASVASWLLPIFGGNQRKKAEKERQEAWAAAIAEVRLTVHNHYDELQKRVSQEVSKLAAKGLVELLITPLYQSIGLRTLITDSTSSVRALRTLRDEIPTQADPQRVLKDAAASVCRGQGPNKEPKAILLGEDWIEDSRGLKATQGSDAPVRTTSYDPSIFETLLGRLRSFVDGFGGMIATDVGERWLRESEAILTGDTEAESSLREVRGLYERKRLRIQLFGDYNAGKTSFIKRLLIDSGEPIGETLEVRANPATSQTQVHEWEDADLIDTPGLQSRHDKHTEAAVGSYPDAGLIVYLLQPNLLVGKTEWMERLLLGEKETGLAPKLDQTLFVIHRSDELGVHPELFPDEYLHLCSRKTKELELALHSRGIMVTKDRILCMSADPFQLVGDRRDVSSGQFDQFRKWDGFGAFHQGVREINRRFSKTGREISVLHGGLARLGRLKVRLNLQVDVLSKRNNALRDVESLLQEITAEGGRMRDEFCTRAKFMIDDQALTSLEKLAGSATDTELDAAAKKLKSWWEGQDFVATVDIWQKRAYEEIEQWRERAADQLRRTMKTPRFRKAVPDAGTECDADGLGKAPGGRLGKLLKLISIPLRGANKTVVGKVGKALGASLRPLKATKIAKLLGKAGMVLSFVSVVVDIVDIYRTWRHESRKTELRSKLRGEVLKSADQVYDSLLAPKDDGTGPIAYLDSIVAYFASMSSDLAQELQEKEAEITLLEGRVKAYESRMAAAWEALNV